MNAKKATEALQWLYKNEPEWVKKRNEAFLSSIIKYYENGGINGFQGKQHSKEFKDRMKGHERQNGDKNSQYGSIWIYSLEEKLSKKIKKEELQTYEKDGWLKGRKMKF